MRLLAMRFSNVKIACNDLRPSVVRDLNSLGNQGVHVCGGALAVVL